MRQRTSGNGTRGRAASIALVLALIGLAGCDGENLFRGSLGVGPDDGRAPEIDFVAPDSGQRVAVGDSVLVEISVSDEQGIARVELSGFAIEGSAELGTLARVERFESKTIDLEDLRPVVRDTTLVRYLVARGDSVPADLVYLVANAVDFAGNEVTDTLRIGIGGPRVQILAPTAGAGARPGAQLLVRFAAADSANRIQSVRLIGSGTVTIDTLFTFEPARASVDTVATVALPASAAPGEMRLRAIAHNSINDSTTSATVLVQVLAPSADATPPSVRFRTVQQERAEREDSVTVTVVANDDVRMGRVGVTLRPIHRLAASTDTLTLFADTIVGDSTTFRVAFSQLGVLEPTTASDLRVEVTAFAFDDAGNCATATIPGNGYSDGCVQQADTVFATRPGARTDVTIVRGATTRPATGSDRLVDLAADNARGRLFVSNFTRNRLEVLPFGARSFSASVEVGSEPWGVTIGINGDTLYAANSGGTNISVIPLTNAVLQEDRERRIGPSNVQLFGVEYDVLTDSVQTVTVSEYSDRPQFLGQISTGQLIYSTKPTTVREPGTIRIIDPAKDRRREPNRGSEVFVNYARPVIGRGIVVNALDAGLTTGSLITVCPRSLLASQTDPACVTGTATAVAGALASLRAAGLSDTRLDLGRDISSIALTDTTFVAVSRDNSTIAFGEGAVDPGRVFLFTTDAGELRGSTTETDDLLGNAAERVIGLALNGDGSLGAARGNRAYYFENDLRLAGSTTTGVGTPRGGIALHPLDVDYPTDEERGRAFVAATDEAGAPYIDVVEAFSFRSIRRIYIRDPIVGTLIAASIPAGDPDAGHFSLRLFGITPTGVLQLRLSDADLR